MSRSQWIWVQDLPTGGLRESSFHNWSFLFTILQVDTRRGLRGETDFTLFREHKMYKEKLSIFSVRAQEKLTPQYMVPKRGSGIAHQSWTCLVSSSEETAQWGPWLWEEAQTSPLHVPGGGDLDGERDCWPQSFLSDKRHNCCRKPSTNQLYISENSMWWIFHGTIMPWGAQPFVWIQQVKANVVCSFLCEQFLGFRFIVQNNHLARPPLKRSGVSSSTHPAGQSC